MSSCFNHWRHLPSFIPLAADVHGFDLQDPSVVFVMALMVVLIAPILFEKIHIPGLIGLIIVGVIMGPHAANLIPEDSLIPPIGSIGLLYLMFLVGLEIDMNRFLKEQRNSIVFGVITFLIPQVLGTLGAVFLLGLSWPTSILMASMFASHTLVPYPIVQRLGLVKERVVTAAAGGTVLTDTLALLVLAVIAETTRGDGLTGMFWLRQGLLFVTYTGVIVWSTPKLSRWFFSRIGNVEGVPGFLYVLTFAFTCAALAPLAGLEPIIGTFLAGLTLNLLIPDHSRLMIRLRFVGDVLFVPFFLLSVGLRVDVGLLVTSVTAWVVMAYMVIAGYTTKFAAATLSGKLLNFNREETGVLFGLSVNQAAATLAAVIVGVRLGIFTEDVLNGTILMILATCLLGPWVTERYGRRLAMQSEERSLDSSGAPERIMVPVSEEEQIEPLIALAMMIREPYSGESLYPAMIVPETEDPESDVARAERLLANATLQAVEAEMPVHSIVRLSDNMVEEILGASRELRISTLVMDDRLSFPREFEHIPTRLIEQGRQMVFRFLNPAMLNTCRRVQVALPPLMERQAGFQAAWNAMQRLAGQMGASMQIITEKATLQAMTRRKYLNPGDPQVEQVPLVVWSRIMEEMHKHRRTNDLSVFFLARTGQLAWDASHTRIPFQAHRLFNKKPCLIIYPPELKWEKEPAIREATATTNVQSMLPPNQVFLNIRESTLTTAIERMVGEFFPDPEKTNVRKRLLTDLQLMAREAALRLSPECLLLHSHNAASPAPMILLASHPEGFQETDPDNPEAPPPRILILLLGVPKENAEEHLRRLAAIAAMLRQEGIIDRLINARSYEDIIS